MPVHKVYNTPLLKKIGVKSDQSILVLEAPENILQLLDAEHMKYEWTVQPSKKYDLIWLFTNTLEDMESSLKNLRDQIVPNGMIWVSWYKKSSKLPSELNEDFIRATALALDLVDIKVASVDQHWSALKLVVPVDKR